MAVNARTQQDISDLTLWLKYRNGDELVLSDVPKIVPLRWQYFKENWEFFKPALISRAATYTEPDYLITQINDMSDFIDTQRSSLKKINPFSDQAIFFRFYGIFDAIKVSSIELSNQETKLVNEAIDKVVNYNKNDFLRIRKSLESARDIMVDEIGLTDADYNKVVNRSPVPQQLDATIGDVTRIKILQDTIGTVNYILANTGSLNTSFVDPFALARVNANNSEFEMAAYKSGNLVRLNYGEDLQLLAKRYLGNPDKWIDIAIANGLKAPYIDEIGEKLSLISNGQGSQININGTDLGGSLNIDKLFINQVVFLQSDVEKFPEQRVITNLRQVPVSGEIVIELSGDADMNRFKLSEGAYLRVFKPNTINSNFYILIPSERPLPNDRPSETPFFLASATEPEKRAKVDLAINDSGELLFNSTGDFHLSYGLSNAVQAIKLKLVTELGTLRRHPNFGLVNVTGMVTQDVESIKKLLIESIDEQIRLDSRFERVESINVKYVVSGATDPTAFIIQMQVRLAGSSNVVPISFSVAV